MFNQKFINIEKSNLWSNEFYSKYDSKDKYDDRNEFGNENVQNKFGDYNYFDDPNVFYDQNYLKFENVSNIFLDDAYDNKNWIADKSDEQNK